MILLCCPSPFPRHETNCKIFVELRAVTVRQSGVEASKMSPYLEFSSIAEYMPSWFSTAVTGSKRALMIL
jgi:hypothetical protein